MDGTALQDAQLVELAQDGDVGAYEELVRRYQATAHRVAYLVTGVAADAEEVAQEAFVKAYYALGGFRRGAPFRPWLLSIVANEARNRRAWVRRRFALSLDEVAEAAQDEGTSPEDAALERDGRRELFSAVKALPRPDQLVIACRYFLELSEAETAELLEIRRGTVKSRRSPREPPGTPRCSQCRDEGGKGVTDEPRSSSLGCRCDRAPRDTVHGLPCPGRWWVPWVRPP